MIAVSVSLGGHLARSRALRRTCSVFLRLTTSGLSPTSILLFGLRFRRHNNTRLFSPTRS